MAKSQKKKNREAKKPKHGKAKQEAMAPSLTAPPVTKT
jgi:hypothetical protein